MIVKEIKVHSDFSPSGDQPDAIERIVNGLNDGLLHQVLLGVTGSGKTYTMAKIIEATQRPAIIMAPNRLSATKALLERNDTIVVATVSSIYGLGAPESYLNMILHLDRGDIIDQRAILRRLSSMQYTRNDIDFKRATFRVRGDIIDIFPVQNLK